MNELFIVMPIDNRDQNFPDRHFNARVERDRDGDLCAVAQEEFWLLETTNRHGSLEEMPYERFCKRGEIIELTEQELTQAEIELAQKAELMSKDAEEAAAKIREFLAPVKRAA